MGEQDEQRIRGVFGEHSRICDEQRGTVEGVSSGLVSARTIPPKQRRVLQGKTGKF